MKKAFTLVEIMIVVAILGILAAIAIPQFQNHSLEARGIAAKDNLRALRNAIDLYTAQHSGSPPGYPNGDTTAVPSRMVFGWQLIRASNKSGQTAVIGTAGYNLGPYFPILPKNPFNNTMDITIIGNNDNMPAEATGDTGWIYKAAEKTIRLDWPGTDKKGIDYYEY